MEDPMKMDDLGVPWGNFIVGNLLIWSRRALICSEIGSQTHRALDMFTHLAGAENFAKHPSQYIAKLLDYHWSNHGPQDILKKTQNKNMGLWGPHGPPPLSMSWGVYSPIIIKKGPLLRWWRGRQCHHQGPLWRPVPSFHGVDHERSLRFTMKSRWMWTWFRMWTWFNSSMSSGRKKHQMFHDVVIWCLMSSYENYHLYSFVVVYSDGPWQIWPCLKNVVLPKKMMWEYDEEPQDGMEKHPSSDKPWYPCWNLRMS